MKLIGLYLLMLAPSAFAAPAPVPEPSTAALFAAGALAVGLLSRLGKRGR